MVNAVEELRKGKSKSVRSAEWWESDGLLQFRGKIYVPPDPDLAGRRSFLRIAGARQIPAILQLLLT